MFFRKKETALKTNQNMTEIPLIVIELENENYHILIEGKFEDESTSYWIIDTGASKSVLDLNLTGQYEIIESDNSDDYQSAGINQGMLETSVGKISCICFGDLQIKNHKAALIDLNHVNEIYQKYTSYKISGLIGGDILMHYQCQIDYSRKVIQFNTDECA